LIDSDDNYCIIGFGNHAQTKLLPSLIKLEKKIFGIVSKKINFNYQIEIFKNLDDALLFSNKDTYFVISTPPQLHFLQTKKILENNRNVFLEKPGFINEDEVGMIYEIIKNNNLFVVELLMYKYTKLYQKFLKIWYQNKKKCTKITCVFNIPKIPPNTFRDNRDIYSSPLYDIGCYLITLLVDLNLSLRNLKIIKIISKKSKVKQFYINGFDNKIEIYLEFGISDKYENYVSLDLEKKSNIKFENFFNGREIRKKIIYKNDNKYFENIICDVNGFETIFKHSHSYWIKNQSLRFDNLILVNEKLSSFVKDINS